MERQRTHYIKNVQRLQCEVTYQSEPEVINEVCERLAWLLDLKRHEGINMNILLEIGDKTYFNIEIKAEGI